MQPKTHKAIFIIPGLCSYESEGNGVWLFQKSAIDKCYSSFIGKPVQIGHEAGAQAVGYVCGAYFDEALGVYVADFFLLDDKAEEMVASGNFYPSCAYTVLENGEGGVYNEIAYSIEILNAAFDHLAIVDSPRYSCGTFDFQQPIAQNCDNKPKFELKAVNSGGRMVFFNNTAKNEGGEPTKVLEANPAPAAPPAAPPAPPAQQEPKTIANAVVEVDGQKVSLADMVEAYKQSKAAQNEGEQVLGDEESIDIEGEIVKIKDIVAIWKSATNSGKEDPPAPPKEDDPHAAENKTAKNSGSGIYKIKQAVNKSSPVALNSSQRLPTESKQEYNKRMTELHFGNGGK